MKNVIGIDYSITSPAICQLGDDFQSSKFIGLAKTKKMEGIIKLSNGIIDLKPAPVFSCEAERYSKMADLVIEMIRATNGPLAVYMEGFAYGAHSTITLGQNVGVLKYRLWKEFGIEVIELPPSTVKKTATGKGNASKEHCWKHLVDSEGVDVRKLLGIKEDAALGSPVTDIIDSYYVALAGDKLHGVGKA